MLMTNETTGSKKEILFRYIEGLFAKGGPEPEDYPGCTQWVVDLKTEIEKGTMTAEEARRYWFDLGEEYLEDSTLGNVLAKRHGYAGDFEVIDKLYRQHVPKEHGKWDLYLHAQEASIAVRNRKDYFISVAAACAKTQKGETCSVLDLGSGPARDILEYIERHPEDKVEFECIDHDPTAIAYAKGVVGKYLDRITFHQANVLKLKPTKKYNLIWSAGLFDYLSDRLFVAVLGRFAKALAPSGEMVVGNFGTKNPTHNCMEFMGDWILNYRDEETLIKLAKEAGIDDSRIRIGKEPLGINLFLHIAAEK